MYICSRNKQSCLPSEESVYIYFRYLNLNKHCMYTCAVLSEMAISSEMDHPHDEIASLAFEIETSI